MANSNKKDVGAILNSHGVSFRVWAPFADSVSLQGTFSNWDLIEMSSEQDGYWQVFVKGAQAGQEYKYVIKKDDKQYSKNDPRALHITTNSGNSVIASNGFDWEDDCFVPPPINKQIIYELHIGTFNRPEPYICGTFDDVIQKLDYLADLGINMIELMPINSMLMDRGWGYAPDYIYAIESLYGGRYKFLELVKAAHKKNIGIILDVVYNHFGPDNNMDLWRFDGWFDGEYGGIYFYNDWRAQTPWGTTRPDFGRNEVRQYLLDNVKMWMSDFRLDGLRVDSTIYLRNVMGNNNDPQNDLPEAWQLMQQISKLSKKINPNGIVIAEDVGCNDYVTKPESDGGAGFDSQWEVWFPSILKNVLSAVNDSDRNLTELCEALARNYNGNSYQRVIYSDSHDSAANGNARLAELISPGKASSLYARRRCLQAAAIVLTSPGVPMLFQGQEFMQGGSFTDWQALDWKNADKFSGIVTAHKHLINLRKNTFNNTAGLSGQSINIIHLNEESKILAYHRWDSGGAGDDVMVIINFANKTVNDYVVNFPLSGNWIVRFNSDWKGYSSDFKDTKADAIEVNDNYGSITIGPYSVVILSQDC